MQHTAHSMTPSLQHGMRVGNNDVAYLPPQQLGLAPDDSFVVKGQKGIKINILLLPCTNLRLDLILDSFVSHGLDLC